MATSIGDLYQFTGGDNFTKKFDYDGSNNVIYQGFAAPGTATSTAGWRIIKLTYNVGNFITDIQFPKDATTSTYSGGFSFIWDNRTTLSFG